MNSISITNLVPLFFTPKKNVEKHSLWNTELRFEKGKKYLVIAPSGTGKSTLATALFSQHFEYNGTIKYDEKDVKLLSIDERVNYRKKEIQLLFQDVKMIPELSLRANINLRLFTKPSNESKIKLNHYSKILGLESVIDQEAKKCSYGERQRAAIIRSLIAPTDFMIFDECFSHLDQKNKEIAFQLIHEVSENYNTSVIFFELNNFTFTHDLQLLYL